MWLRRQVSFSHFCQWELQRAANSPRGPKEQPGCPRESTAGGPYVSSEPRGDWRAQGSVLLDILVLKNGGETLPEM